MTAPTKMFVMPQSILKLFEPRPPLPYVPPVERKRKLPEYNGVAQFLNQFEEQSSVDPAKLKKGETKIEKKARIAKERQEQTEERIAEELARWNPHQDAMVQGDPYKTLFVARLSYESTKHKLKREFEQYGPIKRIRVVEDSTNGEPRGYAFIEFERERDMRTAYKSADGKKIDGRRILVDVERGRSVKNWRPRRLGGGLGSTRMGGKGQNRGGDDDRDRDDRRRDDYRYNDRDRPPRDEPRRDDSRDRGRDTRDRERR
eukprot:CAMPEP_0184661434 /NCGR_PEP_ID=MMETSP0308-20130426/38392_1 /TAXON_ID=38269 /ORGANISM="Gloeochaete witrockiana, Strain SAG 46.84" /LENGTH=258 /DNA_ID=CAMNT_0027102741 /DNA_START=112 /DNA_END=888 /DNA_ORIENTATION=+